MHLKEMGFLFYLITIFCHLLLLLLLHVWSVSWLACVNMI